MDLQDLVLGGIKSTTPRANNSAVLLFTDSLPGQTGVEGFGNKSCGFREMF